MIDLAHAAGRYGAYVWPAYGASAVGLVALIVDTLTRARGWRREVDRLRAELTLIESDNAD